MTAAERSDLLHAKSVIDGVEIRWEFDREGARQVVEEWSLSQTLLYLGHSGAEIRYALARELGIEKRPGIAL